MEEEEELIRGWHSVQNVKVEREKKRRYRGESFVSDVTQRP